MSSDDVRPCQGVGYCNIAVRTRAAAFLSSCKPLLWLTPLLRGSVFPRALWLATPDASDPGRPPLPDTHVVRISQSWTDAPPNNSAAIPPTCNVKAWAKLCKALPNGGNNQQCLSCCKNNAQALHKLGCDGYNVWPSYVPPPPPRSKFGHRTVVPKDARACIVFIYSHLWQSAVCH
jgi:hypothetical protein